MVIKKIFVTILIFVLIATLVGATSIYQNMNMKGNDIFNATSGNFTNLYQAGNAVIDLSDEGNLNVNFSDSANKSDYWDNLNTESDLTPSNFITAGDWISWTADTLNIDNSGILGSANDLDSNGDILENVITDREINNVNASQVDNFDISGPNSYYYANKINMSDESVTYVDGRNNFLDILGGGLFGDLNMNENEINNVSNITGTSQVGFPDGIKSYNESTFKDNINTPQTTGVSSEGNKLYQTLDADRYDFSTEETKDSSPLETNDGTLNGKTFNDGTPNGGANINDGAMKFDGVDDYVNISNNADFYNSELTVSVWANTSNFTYDIPEGRSIIGNANYQNGGFYIAIDEGILHFKVNNDSSLFGFTVTASDYVTKGEWAHYTLKLSGGTLKGYVDGQEVGSTSASISQNTDNLLIGDNPQGGWDKWNGSIDDVQIYERALTETEIQEQYNLGRGNYAIEGDGLVGQWNGRDYEGTESSPTTIYDTNHLVDGKIKEAIHFDGSDDYVSISSLDDFNTTQPYTVSTFLKVDNLNKEQEFIAKITSNYYYSDMSLRVMEDGIIDLLVGDGSSGYSTGLESNSAISPNEWYHIVHVFDGSNYYFYINGESDAQTSVSSNYEGGNSFAIGRRGSVDNGYLNGSIDEVKIYDRALSDDEIKNSYNRKKTAFTDSNPAGHLGNFGVRGDAYIVNGSLIMESPNGSQFECGVDNTGAFSCS